ncbi:MAG: hypothetical protein KF822_03940 [Steroidobacteraceae bacterium]|nr:hypothetical protein [Steroidobacteraceae bacterium]
MLTVVRDMLYGLVALTAIPQPAWAQESAGPRAVEIGDTRPCYMKLKEPNIDGQQIGDLEVVAVATIGADGRVLNVDVPLLATMKAKPWAKNRVQRWATCVIKTMRFEPGVQDGVAVQAIAEIPLKSWTEVGQDLLNPRQSMPARLRSSPEEFGAAYRQCVTGEITTEQRVVYQFSVDEDGRARNVRVLDSGTPRDANRLGHCIIERLRFEPLMLEGRHARLHVHWGVIILPQPGG